MPIWEGFGEKVEQVKSKFSYVKDQKVCFSLFFLVSQETCSSEMFQLIDASLLKPKGFLDQKRN